MLLRPPKERGGGGQEEEKEEGEGRRGMREEENQKIFKTDKFNLLYDRHHLCTESKLVFITCI